MTWQTTGASCTAFPNWASNSGTCGTILFVTSAPDRLAESHTVHAGTLIMLTLSIYSEIVFQQFSTFTSLYVLILDAIVADTLLRVTVMLCN